MARSISEQLHAAIQRIDRPGSFCMSGSDSAVNPGLEVTGLGPIGLPLTTAQAKELKKRCRQAPYGKGESTLVDTSVRRVWQLDPDHFTITNPDWQSFLRDLVVLVQYELGLENQTLQSHLYNLLLYERGSFFLPHRDGEKLDRMVATLVVVLPSTYQGGELIVRHEGEERVIDFRRPEFNAFHTHFAAFYADCEHEVKPLQSGYRLCLVYNLTLNQGDKPVSVPHTTEHVETIAQILRNWSAADPIHKLAVTLEHRYTQNGLTWDALKGLDRRKAKVLLEAAQRAGCEIYLALLTLWQSGEADVADVDYDTSYRRRRHSHHSYSDSEEEYEMGEVYETSLSAEHWTDAAGLPASFGAMQVLQQQVVPPDSLTQVKPEEYFHGYTGNAGMTLERWYRHGAILLWPKSRQLDVLCDCGLSASITSLQQLISQWPSGVKAREAARQECVALATKIIQRVARERYNEEQVNDLLAVVLTLDDPELVRQILRDLLAGVPHLGSGRPVVAACQQYGWTTFQAELVLVLSVNADRTNDWGEKGVPDRRVFARNCQLLEVLCRAKSRRKSEEAERVALCGRLAKIVLDTLESVEQSASQDRYFRFEMWNRPQLLVSLSRALLAIHEHKLFAKFIGRVLAKPELYPFQDQISALTTLGPWLKTQLKTPSAGVTAWFEACQRHLESRTAAEPTPPTDFRRDADLPCKCNNCKQLREFLHNPTESVFRFRAPQNDRSHLEHMIRTRECDVTCKTERVGSPHVLVCTKNQASFEARLTKYHENTSLLKTLRQIEKSLPR